LFQRDQELFSCHAIAARIATDAGAAYNAVAWDDDRYRVGAIGAPD
jgi:hypothetical protein